MAALTEIRDSAGLRSLGEGIRESIRTRLALQHLIDDGYSRIILRDPNSQKERELVIPGLSR